MTIFELPPKTVRSHELVGEYWFNSDPVPVAALRGRVILLVFWDLGSVLSLRAMPYCAAWESRYRDAGLNVVGVHSPRLDFASRPETVLSAIKREQITCSVVCDNSHQVAAAYEVRMSPTFILIDSEGFVRYRNEGDRDYEATEHGICTLLHRADPAAELPEPVGLLRTEDDRRVVRYRSTPDLRAGYLHGNLGNNEAGAPEEDAEFRDPELYLEGRIYLDGCWYVGRNHLAFEGHHRSRQGSVVARCNASETYAVFLPEKGGQPEVTVTLDGRYLSAEQSGNDISVGPDGRTYVRVTEPRPYHLVRNSEGEEHIVRLTVGSAGLTFYGFAFVAGAVPETVSRS